MICPHCGADQRLGVWLSKTEIELFDCISKAGTAGCPSERLGKKKDCYKQHIYNINCKLAETDFRIKGSYYDHRYRIARR